MIFREFFEPLSNTHTGCETTGQAMLNAPIVNAIDGDLRVCSRSGSRWR